MEIRIEMPEAWREIAETTKKDIYIASGRDSGKSSNAVRLGAVTCLANPDMDIVVTRASYGSMGDSTYSEFTTMFESLPEEVSSRFSFRKSPLRIERTDGRNVIYFIGSGGSNKDRTKGFKPKHRIGFVIVEEAQEFRERESYDQFIISIRRNLGGDFKIITLGNPPAHKAHWFNQMVNEKRKDLSCLVKKTTWRDIHWYLNDFDIKEILKTYIRRPEYARWMYDGEPTGAFGSVYPMFDQKRHVITSREFAFFLENEPVRIAGVVIGGDGAVNRDSTSFVPVFILTNGQSFVGPIFHHDPKKSGQMGYHKLVQDHVSRWFKELLRAYNLGTAEELERSPYAKRIPIWFRIDSAAPDLVQECKFFFSGRADVREFRKSTITAMVGVCQSAISADMAYIIDYGGHYNYVENRWEADETNILAEQLDQLVWNEQETGYDPIVPNDDCDAWTYATNFWYANTENIQWFNILAQSKVPNCLIRDRIKVKEN